MVESLATAPASKVSLLRRFLGWCVHAFTASGIAIAAVILYLLVQGGPDAFRWSFLLMILATLVDAVDGTFARAVRIKEAVPSFDGRRLDDITDWLTYTCLPLMLIWRAGLIPEHTVPWLIAPLLASAYGFCQVDIKTHDGYFLGFPSLWNVVALYIYALPVPPWPALYLLLLLAFLTFVPVKHLYPSMPGKLNRFATITGAVWGVLVVALVFLLPTSAEPERSTAERVMAYGSMIYPAFYMVTSWYITLKGWAQQPAPSTP
ncbi:CDP-alcohol phosphatidyltransferase family protein [Paludisphaera rhizosphaerae]|uniref:CDP-alcohol phosphatidyltransferase family protein n=1 Tax=Paludisphaera rhizosphaerae TaxID=2711216 RepID=UPI0013EB14A5|nr:CDP-alcohol phosphatidyltransferase family protein [Paludisphaera rhizosphaerae]